MGYRYHNKMEEENERRWLATLPHWRRCLYRCGELVIWLLGIATAFWAGIGWWLVKLF